jgi:hypothetical protein
MTEQIGLMSCQVAAQVQLYVVKNNGIANDLTMTEA